MVFRHLLPATVLLARAAVSQDTSLTVAHQSDISVSIVGTASDGRVTYVEFLTSTVFGFPTATFVFDPSLEAAIEPTQTATFTTDSLTETAVQYQSCSYLGGSGSAANCEFTEVIQAERSTSTFAVTILETLPPLSGFAATVSATAATSQLSTLPTSAASSSETDVSNTSTTSTQPSTSSSSDAAATSTGASSSSRVAHPLVGVLGLLGSIFLAL